MVKAIVLAGGGSRGSYQIGAWEALEELGYKADIVTGTSVGSMNAALLATDRLQEAKSMWLSINDKDVMDVPEKIFSVETLKFVRKFAKEGGISVEPLKKMMAMLLDEDALRNAKCKYGLVTVNLNTKKPMELTIDDIPKGKVLDYMLASGACFPFLQKKEIDGEKYIDGGYYDNMPANLACKMGAEMIVTIDLDGIGFNHKLPEEYKHVKVISVSSYHDLGTFLEFKPKIAKRNMQLGYLDTYKAFGKLDGWAYAFKKGEIEKIYNHFGTYLMEQWEKVEKYHPAVMLAGQVYFKVDRNNPKKEIDKFLAVLEGAMLSANMPVGIIYTLENLPWYLDKIPDNIFTEKLEQLTENTAVSRLLAPVGAADVKRVFLSLLRTLV